MRLSGLSTQDPESQIRLRKELGALVSNCRLSLTRIVNDSHGTGTGTIKKGTVRSNYFTCTGRVPVL